MPAQVVELVDAVKIQTGGAVALESGQCMTGFIVDGYNDAGRDGKDLRLGKAVCFQHPADGFLHPVDLRAALQQPPADFCCYFQQFVVVHPPSSSIIIN